MILIAILSIYFLCCANTGKSWRGVSISPPGLRKNINASSLSTRLLQTLSRMPGGSWFVAGRLTAFVFGETPAGRAGNTMDLQDINTLLSAGAPFLIVF